MAGKTTDRVYELASPLALELGLSIWDVRFVKEGASYYLRVFIDKPDGIGITDCENLSRLLDTALDETDFITGPYYLEVCSPGLERELTLPAHFEQMLGREVKVLLWQAADGRKELTGILKSYDKGSIVLLDGDISRNFTKKELAYVKLNDLENPALQ